MQISNDQRPTTDANAHPHLVEVELNGAHKRIAGGEYTGRTLKLALGVPVEHELDQVIHHEFRPIANDERLNIHGGEKFVSHCGQGQSS